MTGAKKILAGVFPFPPSWPFRTASARTVWSEVERRIRRGGQAPHPREWDQILREALEATDTPAHELTAEDWALLRIALQWLASTLPTPPVAKEVPDGASLPRPHGR